MAEHNSKVERLIAGVDDAGRGPVIGPLVIAGVLIKESKLQKLVDIGVRDSKLLTPQRRSKLAVKIMQIVEKWAYEIISPSKIDEAVQRKRRGKGGLLNEIEAGAMARVIMKLRPDVVFVDASDINEERYAEMIRRALPFEIEIVSKHKADQIFPVVAAASILAKVKRDSIISELREIYGDFGSGYPTDPKTIEFLKQYFKEHGNYPDIVRKSWKTLRKIEDELCQKMMDEHVKRDLKKRSQ
ncbi:MAG: ribonuclease HII [Candidatus Methanomethylicota archaeon]|uniref:Ribonuclease HII n=1 Tax=Thermoproteota archaeon TaxID=2056631 RepID=A0A497EYC1_9CREN|nr:MAG: ribonuclease HII [Candidatus Verstraetearchaeota archaeon]RLE54327.1 MAG: ribonuclease HII [Candidatus Verstraetearchaeota archaeon]